MLQCSMKRIVQGNPGDHGFFVQCSNFFIRRTGSPGDAPSRARPYTPAHLFLRTGVPSMIVSSLLDTDFYKFTMMQVVLHGFPSAQAQYQLRCRTQALPEGVSLADCADEIRSQIAALCALRFTQEELQYLRSIRFIKSDFVDFLELFHLQEKYITVTTLPRPVDGCDLNITIQGPWLHVVLFDIPVLAIINEVHHRRHHPQPDFTAGRMRLLEKISQLRAPGLQYMRIADYGTRRRFSRAWHEEVLRTLHTGLGTHHRPGQPELPGQLAGTSNVLLAMRMGLTPLGTMSHEFMQACQALGPRLRDSQSFAFEAWAHEYRGDLGIAISDACGMPAFLRDFDLYFCKLFDGVRHDSGDPLAWGEQMLAHYQAHRVEPLDKTLIFSSGLTVSAAIALYHHFRDRTQLAFGLGTHLTNDLGLGGPLPLAFRMMRCNGQPVASYPASPAWSVCEDDRYLAYLRQVFGITA